MKNALALTETDICVIGLGYIGLPTAVFFAKGGYSVVGTDTNSEKIALLSGGTVPFEEPGLPQLFEEVTKLECLKFSTQIPAASIYILAVPTPMTSQGEADNSMILQAVASVAPKIAVGTLVILESTCAPGTLKRLEEELVDLRPDLLGKNGETLFDLVYCPERVLPGRMVEEFVSNDRIVGGYNTEATSRAAIAYRSFCQGEIIETNAAIAEVVKLAENSYRDINIAFANELSIICDDLGIDVREAIRLANRHPRVNILNPGPGVGGHCIAVDPWFLAKSSGSTSGLIAAGRRANLHKTNWVVGKIVNALKEQDCDEVVLFGLAFKPNVDDLRESPALEVLSKLHSHDFLKRIGVVEPNLSELPALYKNDRTVELVSTFQGIHLMSSSNALGVLLVNHDEFLEADWEVTSTERLLDFCGLLS